MSKSWQILYDAVRFNIERSLAEFNESCKSYIYRQSERLDESLMKDAAGEYTTATNLLLESHDLYRKSI